MLDLRQLRTPLLKVVVEAVQHQLRERPLVSIGLVLILFLVNFSSCLWFKTATAALLTNEVSLPTRVFDYFLGHAHPQPKGRAFGLDLDEGEQQHQHQHQQHQHQHQQHQPGRQGRGCWWLVGCPLVTGCQKVAALDFLTRPPHAL